MKKVMGIVAAVVVVAVAGVNAYNAQVTETAMSDLQLENLEALGCEECRVNIIKQNIGCAHSCVSHLVDFVEQTGLGSVITRRLLGRHLIGLLASLLTDLLNLLTEAHRLLRCASVLLF